MRQQIEEWGDRCWLLWGWLKAMRLRKWPASDEASVSTATAAAVVEGGEERDMGPFVLFLLLLLLLLLLLGAQK